MFIQMLQYAMPTNTFYEVLPLYTKMVINFISQLKGMVSVLWPILQMVTE